MTDLIAALCPATCATYGVAAPGCGSASEETSTASACIDQDEVAIAMVAPLGLTISGCADLTDYCSTLPPAICCATCRDDTPRPPPAPPAPTGMPELEQYALTASCAFTLMGIMFMLSG